MIKDITNRNDWEKDLQETAAKHCCSCCVTLYPQNSIYEADEYYDIPVDIYLKKPDGSYSIKKSRQVVCTKCIGQFGKEYFSDFLVSDW